MKRTALLVLVSLTLVANAHAGTYEIVGNNALDLQRYATMRQDVKALMATLRAELIAGQGVIERYRRDGQSQEAAEQSERFTALTRDADQKFGQDVWKPLPQCVKMASMAQYYWDELLRSVETDNVGASPLKRAKKYYDETVTECRNAIRRPLKAEILVSAPVGAPSPAISCDEISDLNENTGEDKTTWVCPKGISLR